MNLTKKANNANYLFATEPFIIEFVDMCKLAEWSDVEIIHTLGEFENEYISEHNKQFASAD